MTDISLIRIIFYDFRRRAKAPLLLLLLIVLSAFAIISVVHHTRLLTTQKEQLALEKAAANVEWRNLILEENVLVEHNRIERIASEKLHMVHVKPEQENIVILEKSRPNSP